MECGGVTILNLHSFALSCTKMMITLQFSHSKEIFSQLPTNSKDRETVVMTCGWVPCCLYFA